MKVIIYSLPDNSVVLGNIVHETGEYSYGIRKHIESGKSEPEALNLAGEQGLEDLPQGTTFRIGDTVNLPGGQEDGRYDRLFYNAKVIDPITEKIVTDVYGWTDALPGDQIDEDITKSAKIAHVYRRANREKLMAPLDKEEGYASTTPERKAIIAGLKQDILNANAQAQTNIDDAANPTAIREVLLTAGMVQPDPVSGNLIPIL